MTATLDEIALALPSMLFVWGGGGGGGGIERESEGPQNASNSRQASTSPTVRPTDPVATRTSWALFNNSKNNNHKKVDNDGNNENNH